VAVRDKQLQTQQVMGLVGARGVAPPHEPERWGPYCP